jgi:biotin transport system substrate-specific component
MHERALTVAEVFRPRTVGWSRFYDAVLIVGGSLVVAISAQLSVWLPFSPVPVTGQTFAVLMMGALLGARRGALCILVYLLEGATGLPVFAAGAAGIPWMIGPTGGYLVGFVIAAWVVGRLCERGWDRNVFKTACAMVTGNVCIHVLGIVWLSCLAVASGSGFSLGRVLSVGVYPFVIGDVIKIILAAVLLPCGWKLLSRMNRNRDD